MCTRATLPVYRPSSPLTQTTLPCQVGNAQAGELFGALLAGFTVEDGTLVFECFGQSGFGDERGEPYPGETDDGPGIGDDISVQTARETLAQRKAGAIEAKAELERVIMGVFGQLEPEPEQGALEGVPPT